jgi:hypothetical protein
MKASTKLAIVSLLLFGATQVLADSNSAMQGVSTTRKTTNKNTPASKPAVVPSRAPISDQAAGGVLTSNRTAAPPEKSNGKPVRPAAPAGKLTFGREKL